MTEARRLGPLMVLTLAFAPGSLAAQDESSPPPRPRDEVVWHWFGDCAGSDSLALEVTLDGAAIYTATFPICRRRRADIKPEPQERLLAFGFQAVPRRFGPRDRTTDARPIDGNVWEAGREAHAMRLGFSFATGGRVLVNFVHVARVDTASRTVWIRGLVITTRPLGRSGHLAPAPKAPAP